VLYSYVNLLNPCSDPARSGDLSPLLTDEDTEGQSRQVPGASLSGFSQGVNWHQVSTIKVQVPAPPPTVCDVMGLGGVFGF
jgi:hypothetical protein